MIRGCRGSIRDSGRRSLPLHIIHTDSGAYPVSCLVGFGGVSRGVKPPRREANHSATPGKEFVELYLYPYVSMAWFSELFRFSSHPSIAPYLFVTAPLRCVIAISRQHIVTYSDLNLGASSLSRHLAVYIVGS